MERDAELGVLGYEIDKHGGDNGPRTFALAAGCTDTGYYSVMVVLWSLISQDRRAVQKHSPALHRTGMFSSIRLRPRRGLIVLTPRWTQPWLHVQFFCFAAFSRGKPLSTSLENALMGPV
jgi:hypothetical protein